MVRVRFAPSPTGYIHIGNARTALFNYLFARKHNGIFILRIENTDTERSHTRFEESIFEDLKWLGLSWDEGPDIGGPYQPYRQMERLNLYRAYANRLLSEGKAYRCWCTKEEIEKRTKTAGYDNYCRNITDQQISKFQSEGRKPVIRFKVPEKDVIVEDIIRGTVKFEAGSLNDFVILKSNEIPTFHFAVVIDDFEMKITHVIRGEDHLSNTPKHILTFEALGQKPPRFAHMSMTLGPDRTRLSKRHGATSIREYRERGFLSDAVFNYLALLGWSSKNNQEIFSRQELIKEFSLESCNKSNAIFDPTKILWMNNQYMKMKSAKEIVKLSIPFLEKAGYEKSNIEKYHKIIEKVVELEKEKFKTLEDLPERVAPYITEDINWDVQLSQRFKTPKTLRLLSDILIEIKKIEQFEKSVIESMIRKFCQEKNLKTGELFHPLRFALTGMTKGPGLFELIEILGKDIVEKRIEKFLEQ